jgi:hypothetical protein
MLDISQIRAAATEAGQSVGTVHAKLRSLIRSIADAGIKSYDAKEHREARDAFRAACVASGQTPNNASTLYARAYDACITDGVVTDARRRKGQGGRKAASVVEEPVAPAATPAVLTPQPLSPRDAARWALDLMRGAGVNPETFIAAAEKLASLDAVIGTLKKAGAGKNKRNNKSKTAQTDEHNRALDLVQETRDLIGIFAGAYQSIADASAT